MYQFIIATLRYGESVGKGRQCPQACTARSLRHHTHVLIPKPCFLTLTHAHTHTHTHSVLDWHANLGFLSILLSICKLGPPITFVSLSSVIFCYLLFHCPLSSQTTAEALSPPSQLSLLPCELYYIPCGSVWGERFSGQCHSKTFI